MSTKIPEKLVDYANTTNVEFIVGFIPWLINQQLFGYQVTTRRVYRLVL